ncbi:hypothetical protein F5B20DRAFT_484481 [Whalleya microplaca]|nr:hypothetical protein F5B20DRAFT_484481 [Whalleya microplaca]
MAKKKSKKQRSDEIKKVAQDWENYFGSGELQDWQRLMEDLGFSENFTSKTQCRKALGGVWVNIRDFLDDVDAGRTPHRFKNEYKLAEYTRQTGKIYPRNKVDQKSPLRKLLAHIF